MPGNTAVGLSFDTTSIKQADEAIKKLVKNAETGIGKVNKAWKDMTKDGLNHFIQRLSVAQRAMSQLSNARVNVRFSGQANDLKRLGDSASRAIPQVNKLITAMQQLSRLNINIVGSGGGGSATAMDAQKIKYLEDQIKLLEKQLKVQQDISKAVGAQATNTNRVRSSMNSLGDAARKVRQIAGTIFSAQALMGYGNQLLQIRGEFEMQHRSLQVLLGDTEKANELWDKTVSLAVKSPFRVKDLVTYTKQLAAYRVEADKLYETNKMLADVSSGLGVDMNRLILAFGQVKAANYLRGTELRQFSEAGVNMLEELAQQYTELEGRMVSVGDVFERVSKRMVSFADVEAVFRKITSEGGRFYQMQEKQAQTTQGMMRNLRDSLDLMFNEIGITHDKAIKGALNIVKQLIDNWRKLVPAIQTAGVAMLAYFSVKAIGKLVGAVKDLWKLFKAHPFAMVGAALAALALYIYRAKKAADELAISLNRIDVDVTASLEESIALYQELADAIRDTTKSNEERDKALSSLQSRFDEILPKQYLERDAILAMADGYDAATQAMMDYYNAKAREQKRDKVESMYGEELYDTDIPELQRAYGRYVKDWFDEGQITQEQYIRLSAGLNNAVLKAVEDVKSGKVANSMKELEREIRSNLAHFANIETYKLPTTVAWTSTYQEQLGDIIETVRKYRSAMASIEGLPYETYDQLEASKIIDAEKTKIDAANKALSKVSTKMAEYTNVVGESADKINEEKGKILEDAQAIVDAVSQDENMKGYAELLSKTFEELKVAANSGGFAFNSALQNIQQGFAAKLPEIVEGNMGELTQTARQMVDAFKKSLTNEAQDLIPTNFQEAVEDAAEEIAKRFGQSSDIFKDFVPQQGESLSNIRQEVKAQIESFETRIKEMQNSLTQGMKVLSLETLNETERDIQSMTAQLPALEAFLAFLGELTEKKGPKDNTLEERIKVIDQMNAKYKELNKTLSESESLVGAFDAYKDAFATAYGREDVRTMSVEDFAKNVLNFPNEDAVVKWLDDLAKTVADKEDKIKVQLAKGKFEMDVDVRLKQDADKNLRKEIEDMFDQYDLSLDLEKFGLSSDLAKQLFDVEYLDLAKLRQEVTKRKDEFIGKDMEEEYEQYLKKIDEMERKSIIERTKMYSEYLILGMNERVKLKVEELKKLKELEESQEFTPDQKKVIREQIQKDTKKEEDKLAWKDFKATDMYTMMFSDLENLGNVAIQNLYNHLDELKNSLQDLDPSEVKEIVTQMEKLQQQMIERNPFEALRDAKDDIHELASEADLQVTLLDAKREEEEAQEILDLIDTVTNAYANGTSDAIDINTLSRYNALQREHEGKLMSQVRKEYKDIVDSAKETGAITAAQLKKYANLRAALKANADAWGEIGANIDSILGSAMDIMENLGVESDSVTMSLADGTKNMAALVVQAIQYTLQMQAAGVATNAAMGVLGWIVLAVQAIGTIISSIANVKNAQIDEQLEKQAKIIERQRDLYDEIEDKVKKAYSVDQLRQYNGELKKNIELEIQALQASIALEKSRKNSDEGQIDAWEKEIQEAKERLAETTQEMAEMVGGIFDTTDFTSGFVDAWWDAMDEGMDGLDALNEHFEETMKDMVKKQALYQGANAIMKQVQDVINKDLAEDYDIDDWSKIWDVAKKANIDLDAFLQGWYDMFGAFSEAGGSGLSALQKGIQGVSEQTAQVIESVLNSMRFTQAESYTELQSQTRVLKDIKGILTDLTSNSPTAVTTRIV
jgi:hypothetical protein